METKQYTPEEMGLVQSIDTMLGQIDAIVPSEWSKGQVAALFNLFIEIKR